MSRQDANAAFALTSFLYGANAPYIEDLYAAKVREVTARMRIEALNDLRFVQGDRWP